LGDDAREHVMKVYEESGTRDEIKSGTEVLRALNYKDIGELEFDEEVEKKYNEEVFMDEFTKSLKNAFKKEFNK